MTSQFSAQPFSPEIVDAAAIYGFLATGIPEEFLFRGLVAGVLFRKFRFWAANLIQSAVFLIPHLLIILVAPKLWWLVTTLPFFLGLIAGYLRERSGSIGPPILVHGLPNTVGALSLVQWGQQDNPFGGLFSANHRSSARPSFGSVMIGVAAAY